MCLIAFAIGASDQWPLVIAANRDEFLDRPALPLSSWQTQTGQALISGRDLLAGGTWLGTTPAGRIAMLTNVRELNPLAASKSRGELVSKWLEGDMDAQTFMAQTDSAAYGGFNLVLGDLAKTSEAQQQSWCWLSNRHVDQGAGPSGTSRLAGEHGWHGWQIQSLLPGIYGLSNAALDTPWPKTLGLKQALERALPAADEAALAQPLWRALQSREQSSVECLPASGLPQELELALSSAFVNEPSRGQAGYGTRCSTLLIARPTKLGCLVSIEERSYQTGPTRLHGKPLAFAVAREEFLLSPGLF
jgi:uncharacterized protein with NRDE domain